jgi:HNH endonuclease/Domain of unknown function (DUF222)
VVDKLAARDLRSLPAGVRTKRLLAWQRLLDRQAGLWLQELATLDACGAAGAELDQAALSTASWLRSRLRMGVGAARSAVRTARALFRGSLKDTAAALVAGAISPAHAKVIADGTQGLPEHAKLDADPVLAELARHLDPPGLRRAPEACRRLACDAAVTRVVVDPGFGRAARCRCQAAAGVTGDHGEEVAIGELDQEAGLPGRLRAAVALLPPVLGGAPSRPLDLGRATRVISPAQRSALAVRDGGCVFPDCDRPLARCEGHHLTSWLDGGPTDLANLALLCRAHHRAVHEGGWQLTRGPDGRFSATPGHRRHHAA